MRRLLRWVLYVASAMLILLVGAVALIQTGPGKQLLAAQLSSLLSTPESVVEISDIEGTLPLDIQVDTIRLADRDGVWLEMRSVAFDWSPSALASGRLQIDEIGAERVEIKRTPLSDDTPEPTNDDPFRLPEIPKSLPPVSVENVALPEIVLGAPLLGEAATFSLQGSIRTSDRGDRATARLDLERTDTATAHVSLEATVDLVPLSLDLIMDAKESGGLIVALAGQPQKGEVALRLDGKGPLDNWSGRLHAEAEGVAKLEAAIALALVDQPRLSIDGEGRLAPGILPEAFGALIGEQLSIDLDLVQPSAQALDVRKATLTTHIAGIDAEGSVNFDEGDLALKASLSAADIEPASTLANAALSGKAEMHLMVNGTLNAPDGSLEFRASDLAFDGKAAKTVTTDIQWTTTSSLSAERPAFDIVIDGQALGLDIPDTLLPDDDVRLNGKLSAPFEGEVVIDHIAMATAGSSLVARGAVDPRKREGTIDLSLEAPSLQRLAAPYGLTIEGKAKMGTVIRLANQADDIAIEIDASLDELAGLPPGAAEILGSEATVEADITLDSSNRVRLEKLAVDGAHIGLEGDASLNLDEGHLAGRINAALPDLNVLETLMPKGIEGAVALKADFGGTLDAPSADVRVNSENLVLAGEPITALDIAISGKELIASPIGSLEVNLSARKTPATLALAYRLADNTLHLEAIDLKAPETEVGGALAIALETALIDGALQGQIAKLDALEPLLQQTLRGSINMAASFAPDGGGQNATLALNGQDVVGDFGSLKTIKLDASITDAKTQPGIDANATLTGFKQGATTIDALTLLANGDGERIEIDLDVAGEALKPFEVAADGTFEIKEGIALGLTRLQGAFAGEPLRLAQPLSLQAVGNEFELAGLDLRLGEARLIADLDIGEETATGAVDLRGLPLRWSEIFEGPSLSGIVSADIDLSGSVSSPKVVAALEVNGALAETVTDEDLPLNIDLSALLDRGRLAANLRSRGLTKKPITATVGLPARLQLRPFAFDMPKDGELDGKIDAEFLLDRLSDLLALDDQSMKGTLAADIAIGGTLAEPKIAGPVILKNAEYEHGVTAARIHSLNMRAIASSERIDVQSFTGRTGKTGALEAEGWLELDADADFPLSLTLRLDKAELVDRDDVEGRISGEIAMVGSLVTPEIKGDLTVNRAEISIPEGGGPNLPEIEVTEVGGNIVNPTKDQANADDKEKPFDPILDIRISLPKKVDVRGRGLESEWRGDLQISGSTSDPAIVGSLEIKKGYFDFLDKRFVLELGELTFSGATPPNPTVALEARAEDDDFVTIIKLSGTANDPQLLLSSEPILPEDEILARLLFNRELSEIGPLEAGKLALAANRLRGGGGGFDAFGEIRNILKIDTLDVVSDEEGESRVRAGQISGRRRLCRGRTRWGR